MKIKEFYYKDLQNGVEVEKLAFDDFSILVGVSGAGKTTIINGIREILRILKGRKTHSKKWYIKFETHSKSTVEWEGVLSTEYNTFIDEEDSDTETYADLEYEKITIDGELLLLIDGEQKLFKGENLPLLDQTISFFHQLRNDEALNNAYKSMHSIVMLNEHVYSPQYMGIIRESKFEKLKEKCENKLNTIQSDEMDTRERIYFASLFNKDKFEYFNAICASIFSNFSEVVPVLSDADFPFSKKTKIQSLATNIKLESGEIIQQIDISSGMFKSIIVIAEVIFGSSLNPIIIDEIENSLGVNCLPSVLDELETAERQVIITTHHPKIINKVSLKCWKIVSRDGSKVKTSGATTLIDSKSHHDNYMKLINSAIYNGN